MLFLSPSPSPALDRSVLIIASRTVMLRDGYHRNRRVPRAWFAKERESETDIVPRGALQYTLKKARSQTQSGQLLRFVASDAPQHADTLDVVCLREEVCSPDAEHFVLRCRCGSARCRLVTAAAAHNLAHIACLCVHIARHVDDQLGSKRKQLRDKAVVASASRRVNDDSRLRRRERNVLRERRKKRAQ